ncbi:MAG: hypothetical protein WC760_09750 [Bacteroidia bacterium]|jgi:hypothetical protein
MKRYGFALLFTFLTSTLFGQQFLWSTAKNSSTKYVPLENVTEKVLEFYDFYEFYVDGSGFSKNGFFKTFDNNESYLNSDPTIWLDLKKKITEIDSLTVIAFKTNLGSGSMITIMCISR